MRLQLLPALTGRLRLAIDATNNQTGNLRRLVVVCHRRLMHVHLDYLPGKFLGAQQECGYLLSFESPSQAALHVFRQ